MEIVKNALSRTGYMGDPRKVAGPDGLAANLTPFDSTTGKLWARRYDGSRSVESLGRYNGYYSDFMVRRYAMGGLSNDYEERGPLYVVYSYGTPIVWLNGWGEMVEGDDYSQTTKQHKSQVTPWLGTGKCSHYHPEYNTSADMANCAVWQRYVLDNWDSTNE